MCCSDARLEPVAEWRLLYVFSTCGFGQPISTFTRAQVAAVFATTVISIITDGELFSLLVPVSSLTGAGA